MTRIIATAAHTIEVTDQGDRKIVVVLDNVLDRPFPPIVLTNAESRDLAAALVGGSEDRS